MPGVTDISTEPERADPGELQESSLVSHQLGSGEVGDVDMGPDPSFSDYATSWVVSFLLLLQKSSGSGGGSHSSKPAAPPVRVAMRQPRVVGEHRDHSSSRTAGEQREAKRRGVAAPSRPRKRRGSCYLALALQS